jgi:type II secretory pathway pseudopilin PulG
MAVVVIIGIASAAALPSFTERVRERRSSQAAEEIALLYKMARARALGRGAAQMVELTPGISGGMNVTFKVREAIQQNDAALTVGTCGPLPLTTCYNDWSAVAVGNNRLVDQFPRDGALYANLEAKLYATAASNDGAVVGQVCFTPSGRAFTRADAGGVWAPVIEIPRIQVKRYVFGTTDKYVGLTRTVLLPPSGAARLAL